MDRNEFMELVYETFADETDNVLANGIIEAADAYAEHEKAQLFSEGTTKDAISRQAALKALRKCQTYLYDARDPELKIELSSAEAAIKELPIIQPQSTTGQLNDGVRSTAQSTDLIDRGQAIDALDVLCQEHRYRIPGKRETYSEYNEAWQDALDRAEGLIFNLPPAQPEPPWISCEERMPEEHEWIGTKKFGTTISDEVYVTFENEKGERFCQHIKFQNGELSRYDQFHMDTWFKGSKPIAWMPLPKPFEGGIK